MNIIELACTVDEWGGQAVKGTAHTVEGAERRWRFDIELTRPVRLLTSLE